MRTGIVWEQGGNLGHLGRLLPIARRLRALGHEVTFVVANAQAAQQYVLPEGFVCIRAPVVENDATKDTERPVLNHADMWLRSGFGRMEAALSCVEAWRVLYAKLRLDAVLVDACPMGLYAARSLGVHCMAIGHGFEIPPSPDGGTLIRPLGLGDVVLEHASVASLAIAFERMHGHFGNSAPVDFAQLYPQGSTLLCTWPEFDHFSRTSSRTYTGSLWSQVGVALDAQWPQKLGAKVLCYLNLVDKRYDLLFQALQSHGANVWVIAPQASERACNAARAWGVMVHAAPVDIEKMISQAQAVVHHGGMGLACLAASRGIQTLILPQHAEQVVLSHRLFVQNLAAGTVQLNNKAKIATLVAQLLSNGKNGAYAGLSALTQRYANYDVDTAADSYAARLCGQ